MATIDGKFGQFPSGHATTVPLTAGQNRARARQLMSAVVKAIASLLLVGCCLGLVYQVIHDKQSYDALLAKYNALESQKTGSSGLSMDALVRRDMHSTDSVSYVYSTTTETQATTITIRKTASTSTPAPTPTKCVGPLATHTVTVTSCPLSGTISSTSLSSSSTSSSTIRAPDTVVVTHVTATTVYITDKGLVTPKVQTLTSTELDVFTILTTVNGTVSTSTSTADAVSGGAATSSLPLTHFPNATNPLQPYRTTSYGGVPLTTANFTVTVPPAGKTTSKSDPTGTVVTAAAHKSADVGAFMVVAAVISFMSFF